MSALFRFVPTAFTTALLMSSVAAAQEAAPAADAPPAPAAAPVAAEPAAAEPTPPAAPVTTQGVESATPPPEAPKPKPPPYSLPFQLRPVVAATVVRSDTAVAFYNNAGSSPSGSTIATTLLASYKITPEFSPLVRLGLVSDSPPDTPTAPDAKVGFMNPAVGGIYALKPSPETRLALFLGATIPIGSGGGDDFDPAVKAAVSKGIAARSAMDNAMFATNYFTVFPGVDFAYVANGLTIQAEATLLQLLHVRGNKLEDLTTPAKEEAARTNLTMGLHAGYFVIPQLSLGAELRHQRWLSTPAFVDADASRRDTTTVAIGARVHFKLSDSAWFRPGIAYSRGLDKPLTTSDYNIVQLDLPFIF